MQLEIRQRIITYVLHERCTKRPNNTDSANNRCELINLTSLGSFFFPSNWVNAHFSSALELIWTPIAFRLSLTPSLPACPDSSHIICPPSTIHFLTVYSHPPSLTSRVRPDKRQLPFVSDRRLFAIHLHTNHGHMNVHALGDRRL